MAWPNPQSLPRGLREKLTLGGHWGRRPPRTDSTAAQPLDLLFWNVQFHLLHARPRAIRYYTSMSLSFRLGTLLHGTVALSTVWAWPSFFSLCRGRGR